MTLTGRFTILDTSLAARRSGIRPGEFDMAPWRAAGAEYLIKSAYLVTGDDAVLEFRLYEVASGRRCWQNATPEKHKDARKMAHTFSDEILLLQTAKRVHLPARSPLSPKSPATRKST